MIRSLFASFIIIVALSALPLEASAQQRHRWGWYEGRPYGDFCPGKGWGGPYGARKQVRTAGEAGQIIKQYFAARQKSVTIGRIEERKWFFLAEILDADGTILDETIVDKRTGRIRSIY